MNLDETKQMAERMYAAYCQQAGGLTYDGKPLPSCAQSPAQAATNAATVLPDGSAFAVYNYPLPKDHWLYAPREYEQGAEEPKELAAPILTHTSREQVVSAIRYAVRAATDCGKETDFDPDALVQNAVYALCGPFSQLQPQADAQEDALDAARYRWLRSGASQLRVLHARVQELEKDLNGAKRLVSKIWNQHPEAREAIEKGTGVWMVFGQDVEASVSAQRVTQAADHIEQPQPQADGRDAQRYRWLIDYFISDRVDLDDAIVAAKTSEDIAKIIDAAIAAAKGE